MDWKEKDNKLVAAFTFKDFAEAFSFMTEVAIYAEKQNHHPSWTNTYNKVSFELNTHDAGNIVTKKDRVLSEKISDIYKKYKVVV